MRYIDYDAKTVSPIINSFCHMRINAYEDSDRSVAIVLDDKKYNQINKTLNSNWTITQRAKKHLTESSFLTMVMAGLFFGVAILNFDSPGLSRTFFILGVSMYILFFLLVFLSSLPNSAQDHALFIEGVGDHFDENDINKVYEMYNSCKNEDEIHNEIVKMIVKKDPAGVRPEFLEWYKNTLQHEKRYVEKRSEELGLLSSSLESGNKIPLSSVKKKNQVESEMNQWEAALSKL